MDYKEKLRLAEDLYNKVRLLSSGEARETAMALEQIFPELRESEDEKIRQEIIEIIRETSKEFPSSTIADKSNTWISWLEKQGEQKPVSIHYDENGEADGVRICSLDEDFVIKLHDEFDGKSVERYEIGNKGVKTFNRKQSALISAYIKEVNEALEEAGGDVLDVWYWTDETCEANGSYAWCLYGSNGRLNCYNYRYYSCRVRSIIDLG